MSHKQTGVIHKIFDTEQITDTFKKREFVLSVESGPYTELVKFELIGDRTDMLDHYKENETVDVHFDLRGREYQGKYFVNLRCWKLEKVKQDTTQATEQKPPAQVNDNNNTEGDDLPF